MITTSKVKDYIDAGHDHYEVARWLLNTEIHKHAPINLEDLSDTATVGNEIEAIVECLDEGDYQDAINISIDGAQIILDEEGFELNNNE